ncbi:MAG: type II toxin-antitoxin system HicA family toxin [Candidatus Diapherotrites archaeon]|nr:type II toxin-antitoxin system HicA family toxin [Candidatus Diapherotrites archaeon]
MSKVFSGKELAKIVIKLGFTEKRVKGSHHQFEHADGRVLTIPIHGNEPVGTGIRDKIIKKGLKMEKEEFYKLVEKL